MRFHVSMVLFFCLFLPGLSAGQQPAPPAAPEKSAPAGAAAPSVSPQESSSKQHRTLPAFLILGTVFNEKGFAFPGVAVRVRRKGEKKFRYELHTNSRGEFAVRVPDGIQYEVVVREKKYQEQTQVVAANAADVQKRLTFKLESSTPAKPGESK